MQSNNTPLSANRVRAFVSANPEIDFASHDLLTTRGELGLDWAGLDPEGDRSALRTYQLLSQLDPDLDLAQGLAERGLVSANHVARLPRGIFVDRHAAGLGLDEEAAEKLHRRATRIRNKTLHLWASVRGTVASPFFRQARTDTVGDGVKHAFESLPSYQELFGSLDYCGCEECRSIFGAAAYLVDLLRIIDESVTEPNAHEIPQGLTFADRRPDIGHIPLSCAATENQVPYLQIVNERLTAQLGVQLVPPGASAAAPESVLEQMATTLVYPEQLPF
ncbi:MAG: Tc toxin subunit A, partial [Holophagales bacterium]|nr:Tc toxin subunit A [Holophagales bacterium]